MRHFIIENMPYFCRFLCKSTQIPLKIYVARSDILSKNMFSEVVQFTGRLVLPSVHLVFTLSAISSERPLCNTLHYLLFSDHLKVKT